MAEFSEGGALIPQPLLPREKGSRNRTQSLSPQKGSQNRTQSPSPVGRRGAGTGLKVPLPWGEEEPEPDSKSLSPRERDLG